MSWNCGGMDYVYIGIAFLLVMNVAVFVGVSYFPQYTQIYHPRSAFMNFVTCAMVTQIDSSGNCCLYEGKRLNQSSGACV